MQEIFKPEDLISTYTSQQGVEDGILFDVDIILKKPAPDKQFFLKYITTGLLAKGYWNNCCSKGVPTSEAYINQACARCPEIFKMHRNNKPCMDPTLNIPNLQDLLSQTSRIFSKKHADDYFASGFIELPSGQKQKIFIAQNETGRYTAMLPEEY